MGKASGIIFLIGIAILIALSFVYFISNKQNSSMDKTNPVDYSSKKLGVGYLPIAQALPLFVAEKNGFFAEQGLNVELVQLRSSQEVSVASIAGDIDVFVSAAAPVINSFENTDLQVRMVVALANTRRENNGSSDFLLGQESIKSVAELKGKKIGVLSEATGRAFFTEILPKYGLTIDDVTIVALAPPQQIAAFASNAVDALLALEPSASIIFNSYKSNVLINGALADIHQDFIPAAIWVNTSSVDRETQQKIYVALSNSLDFIHNNKEEAVKSFLDYTAIPADLLNVIRLPNFILSTDAEVKDNFQIFIDLFKKNGILKTESTSGDWIWAEQS